MTHSYNIYRTLALTLLVLLTQSASAQITLGYCGNAVAANGLSNATMDAPISCAMGLTPTMLEPYTMCCVSELQIGLSAVEGLTSMKVWVRQHLADEEDLASAEIPVEELQIGWNIIQLDKAVTITAQDTLFCGYSYTQATKVKCISTNGQKKTPCSYYISNGKAWGDNNKNSGPVSIRAGLGANQADAVKLVDLRLDRRSQNFQYMGSADYEPILISGKVQNMGSNPLQYITVSSSDNGQQAEAMAFGYREAVLFGQYAEFSFSLLPGGNVDAPACDVPVLVNVAQPNGSTDALLIDCEKTLYYELGSCSPMPDVASYIVEEFTSEDCGYAPIGQQRLREAITEAHRHNLGDAYQSWVEGNLDGYTTHYIIISRHEGYGPGDTWRLSQGSDYARTIFGPQELTFAPAMVVNRSQMPSSTTLSADTLGAIIASYDTPNVVSLMPVEGSFGYDAATNEVSVSIKAILWSAAFCQNPRIQLCITQDYAESEAQKNYYPDNYSSEYQQDIIRSYLTCTSGSGALYEKVGMADIMSGNSPIAEYTIHDAEGNVASVFSFEGVLPEDIQSLDGLSLVGYVYDQMPGGKIYGAFRQKLGK